MTLTKAAQFIKYRLCGAGGLGFKGMSECQNVPGIL